MLVVLVIVAGVLSLYFGGSESIRFSEAESDYIFNHIRIPKTLTAIVAGSGLALAGMVLQIIFRNPLAGPYVLGVSSGASLFVAIGLLAGNMVAPLFFGKLYIVGWAIAGSIIATSLVLSVAKKIASNVVLLLIGLMVSQICGAIQMSLEYFSNPYNLKLFVVWGMGSLSGTGYNELKIMIPVILIAFAVLFYKLKPLTAILYGEAYASNLGIRYTRERLILLLVASLLTGVVTAFCGPIAFVGTAVPILSRLIFRSSDLWWHFCTVALLGAFVLLLADIVSTNVFKEFTLPVNIVTTLIGAPVVIYLMFKNKQW